MLFNVVLVMLYKYFDMSVTDESYEDKTSVWRTKLQSWYFWYYLHHWVDATADGSFVPEGITSPVVNTGLHSGVDMNINNVVIFINFLLKKLWIFRQTKDFLIPDYLSRVWHNFLEFWLLNDSLNMCAALINFRNFSSAKLYCLYQFLTIHKFLHIEYASVLLQGDQEM